MQGIKKYYVGLAVLGLFTLALFMYVLTKGSSYKNDKKINEAAVTIADELNSYVSTEQKVPENLSELHSGEIPKEITYTKESSKRYKFCVTYSGQSGPELDAQSIIYTGLSGNFAPSSYSDYESSYTPSSLYISGYGWSEGEKCYTIEPNLYERSSNFDNFDSPTNLDYVCEETYEYYEYYKNYCKNGKYQYN